MNLDHHFPPPRYRATQRERYSAAAALRQQEDSMDFNPRGEPQRVTRIPDGCDQQGRHPEADPAWREYAAQRAMKTVPPPAAAADSMDGAAGQADDGLDPDVPTLASLALIACAWAWNTVTAPLRNAPRWVRVIFSGVLLVLALIGAGALYGLVTR